MSVYVKYTMSAHIGMYISWSTEHISSTSTNVPISIIVNIHQANSYHSQAHSIHPQQKHRENVVPLPDLNSVQIDKRNSIT